MEPAVVISGFMGMADEKEAIRQFCEGFAKRTAERRGDWRDSGSHALAYGGCVSSFLSRYREGTDESPVLREQVDMLVAGYKRMKYSQEWLDDMLFQCLL